MSTHTSQRRVSIHDIQQYKDRGEKFATLTAYDYLTAHILDDAGIPLIVVGDSLGMVVLGYPSTVPVSIDEMLHHTRAVVRGATRALVVADMPFGSYQVSREEGTRNAIRLLQVGGAAAVKIEGGGPTIELTAHLTQIGVPVMAHIGLTPQSVHQLGGFKVQGRSDDAANRLPDEAVSLAEAGAFAVVIEAVPSIVGRRITESIDVATVGIGAGPFTDGQVLVAQDMLGMTSGRAPRFVKRYADMRETITQAAKAYSIDVASSQYPAPEHLY